MVVWGSGPCIGFLGLGLSVDGVLDLWCLSLWVYRVGALHINIKELTWEKMVLGNESFKDVYLRSIRYIHAPYHKSFYSGGIPMNKLIT